ncbi:MAG: LacI family DNA-binding transcriptional regulator [Gemmatimonadaceae bacterium]
MNSRTNRRPTIVDVAASAGVSKSLVSLVLRGASTVSEERRRLVLAAAAELGYRPNGVARSLVQRRSNLFGILLSDLHNPFFADVIDGVQTAAFENGYNTIISVVDHRILAERRALDTLLDLRIDGLILANPTPEINAVTMASKEVPVVVIARRKRRMNSVDSVNNDDPTGAALAVQHLADLGHQRIAHIDGGGSAAAAARKLGYERAMQLRGLEAHIHITPGGCIDDGGRHGVAALFASDSHPTAIFVANDLAALGALSALSERGLRVPGDVSVVGYDDTALAAVRQINLTTVDQPRADMGRTAVTLLMERLNGNRDTARHVLMPPTLVVRGTTAARRNAPDSRP